MPPGFGVLDPAALFHAPRLTEPPCPQIIRQKRSCAIPGTAQEKKPQGHRDPRGFIVRSNLYPARLSPCLSPGRHDHRLRCAGDMLDQAFRCRLPIDVA
jgi:hypothetical protein